MSILSAEDKPAAATKRLIVKDDFRYLGRVDVVGMGWATSGLAYRPDTKTWFTVERSGRSPYGLCEFSMPEPALPPELAPQVEIVKKWGPLNQEKRLDVKGQLVSLRGLCWDSDQPKLWFSFGSFYASGANNPFLGCATLTGKGLTVYGPWRVSEAVHADTVKGMLFPTPPDLRKITGQRLLAFGVRGSTAQNQSWGTGLVSLVAPALNEPAGAEIHAAPIIHWPMKSEDRTPYSDFPRVPGDPATMVIGNEHVGRRFLGKAQSGTDKTITLEKNINIKSEGHAPLATLVGSYVILPERNEEQEIVAWDNKSKVATVRTPWKDGPPSAGTQYEVFSPSHELNRFESARGRYRGGDGLTSAAWIDLPDKHGLLYFGTTGIGYCWYGNQFSHNDPTPLGKKYANNLKSLLDPEKPVHSSFEGRGWHAEEWAPRWYLVDPHQVLTVAQRLNQGAASAAELQISWKHAGDVAELGGAVELASPRFGQMHWNAETRRLTVLVLPAADNSPCQLHVWQIGD